MQQPTDPEKNDDPAEAGDKDKAETDKQQVESTNAKTEMPSQDVK